MRIGIDVDLVMCASDKAWYEWLQKMCGGYLVGTPFEKFIKDTVGMEGHIDYNLASYFPTPINPAVEPLDFWRSVSTYDTIEPVKGAVETVKHLIKLGHEIVFITHNKGHSSKSKYRWLERHIDADFSYIVTKEKYLVNVDIMIDDRNNFLNGFDDKVKKILFTTVYQQHDILRCSALVADWDRIYEMFLLNIFED